MATELIAPSGTPLPPGRGCAPTRIALNLRPGLAYEEWRKLGEHVAVVADASAWWIGDWLVFGQREYGNRYKQAIAATGLDYQTLRNYAWVAGRFAADRRRDTLSFGHHAEVAALGEDDQEAWLRRTVVEGWSRNELRRRLRAGREKRELSAEIAIELSVPPQRRERWEAAASATGAPLGEWMAEALDQAADTVLAARLAAA